MLPVKSANVLSFFFVKTLLLGNAKARSRPHVRHVRVRSAVVIEIEPACAHPRAGILYARLSGYGSKCSIAMVAIQIAAPEIVGDIEARASAGIIVAPGARKTVAIVVDV